MEKLLAWHVFWSIGACYFVNFIFHAFFGEIALASFIGWSDSPFQFEVGTRQPGFFRGSEYLAAWRGLELRLTWMASAPACSCLAQRRATSTR